MEKKPKRKVKEDKLLETLTKEKNQTVILASIEGASNWLNVLLLKKHDRNLNKSQFGEGLQLRYRNEPGKIPNTCPCSHDFKIDYALIWLRRGCTQLRRDEFRDTIAGFNDNVCHDLEIYFLQHWLPAKSFDNKSKTGEEKTRLDIKANGQWRHSFTRCFLCYQNFFTFSHNEKTFSDLKKHQENFKKLRWEQCILDIEERSFVPEILLFSGGAAIRCNKLKVMARREDWVKRSESDTDIMIYI